MSIKIIQADASHAPVIGRIGAISFAATFRDLFSSATELEKYLDYTYNPQKITASLRKNRNIYFLALLGDVPVGFVKVRKDSLHEAIDSGSQLELQKIYVLPEYQGIGAGSALMKTVKQLASLIQPDYLWVDAQVANTRAIRFYERSGFAKGGKHYFRIGAQVFGYHMMCLPVKVEEACIS